MNAIIKISFLSIVLLTNCTSKYYVQQKGSELFYQRSKKEIKIKRGNLLKIRTHENQEIKTEFVSFDGEIITGLINSKIIDNQIVYQDTVFVSLNKVDEIELVKTSILAPISFIYVFLLVISAYVLFVEYLRD